MMQHKKQQMTNCRKQGTTAPDPCAGGCGCSASDLQRREVLKAAAIGAVASSLGRAGSAALADNAETSEIKHLVPADKKLSPEWVQALFERGRPEVYRGKDLNYIGMPVGGIAAGQLYLRGDGTLGCWQIFNRNINSGYGDKCYAGRKIESPVAQGFAIVAEQDGQRVARTLGEVDFPNVEFFGEYPIARVRYRRDGFPLDIEMEAFSPFIPLNARDSALPATVFHLTAKNTSARSVKVGMLAWLANAVCFHNADYSPGSRRNRIVREKGRTLIVHSAEPVPPDQVTEPRPTIVLADFEGDDYGQWKATGTVFGKAPVKGPLPGQNEVKGYLGKGLVNTFLGGDDAQGTLTSPKFTINRWFLNFLIGGGGHGHKTCLNLIVDGKEVRSVSGKNDERLEWQSIKLDKWMNKEAHIEIVDRQAGPWGHVNIDQIELADTSRLAPADSLNKLEDFGTMSLAFAGESLPVEQTREGLVALGQAGAGFIADLDTIYAMPESKVSVIGTQPVELAPGQQWSMTCVLSWHFPNRKTGEIASGNYYATRFKDAIEAAHYVFDQHDRLTDHTRRWRDTLYDSTLPIWLINRLMSTVSNLATGTSEWWANGRWWAWEGVYCCQGTCTHVWNYAHAVARLFPELERIAREVQDLGTALQVDGLVWFRGEFSKAYAADGQAGTILKCYREHLMSPDGEFLKRNWPKIKKAMNYSIAQDADEDGLIENSQHNTFDINFFGPNSFVGSLYLAALRAAEEMAREMGDDAFADRVRRIHEAGRRLSMEKLWNGEYFVQMVDLDVFPTHQYGQGCLSDQLFGQGWAHHVGLGYIYPEEAIKTALRSIWKYNWAPDVGPHTDVHKPGRYFAVAGEGGMITCTWPKSRHLVQGVLYQNEVWTGVEYQVAGHLLWEGVVTEALAVCRAAHERYHPSKRNPYNEVECGDHYGRALASWGVFTALAGYEYHGPRGYLAFTPRLTPDDFRTAFTVAEGWGTFTQKRQGGSQSERIEIRWGKLRLKTLAFTVGETVATTKVVLTVRDKPIEAAFTATNGQVTITLHKELVLAENDGLDVIIS